jgi:[acyl-carrier-protein] S-malonyltransferase
MIVLLCPGQGSQKPGFLNSWLDIASFKENISELAETISSDLVKHGTLSDEETIRDTAIAQPLIVAASIATANLLDRSTIAGVAGHSVGEVAAGYISNVLTEKEAINLVHLRGNAMAEAAKATPGTGMAAILGGDEEAVLSKLSEFELYPANFNGAGQIVAAGLSSNIQQLVANPPQGSKVIPLSVAGAFHTSFMEPAVAKLSDFVSSLEPKNPSMKLWSNQNGQLVESGSQFLTLLVGQVANSVRWDLCMKSMVAVGVTGVIELSPGGTLAGLAKRGMPGVEIVALKQPEDLETARALIASEA